MVRRTAQEAAETRATLLLAGRSVFTEKGFIDTTLEEVGARAGVTTGAVYHHFRDKRELFATVFRDLERELDAVGRAAARSSAGRPRDAFLAGCRAYLEFAQRPDFQRVVLVDGPAVLGPAGWHSADSELGLPTLEAAVRALIAVGEIAPQPVAAARSACCSARSTRPASPSRAARRSSTSSPPWPPSGGSSTGSGRRPPTRRGPR